MCKILYVDNVDSLDYNYLPIYKKCDNGKYLQLCLTKISDEVLNELNENVDITPLILGIDGFHKSMFNELSKKLKVKFIEHKIEEDEEKQLLIKRYIKFQKITINE